jgi:hypothetical protein
LSVDESIVEKIKKLLALADGNQNEHERAVAMQFAMELLAKHNLSMSEVKDTDFGTKTDEFVSDFRLDPWVRVVIRAACKLYYTEVYTSTRYDLWGRKLRVAVFVGTTENIAVTMEVAGWLVSSIRNESNRAYKEQFERRSFRLGAADRILDRAKELMEAERHTATTSTGTSLMVVRNQLERANHEHLAKLNLRHTRRRSSYIAPDAYSRGEKYGERVRLSQYNNTSTAPARLPQASAVS